MTSTTEYPRLSGATAAARGPAPRTTLTALWLVAAGVFLLAVFFADYVTGADVALSFFYLIPIALVTWFLGRDAGLGFCALAVIGWTSAYFLTGRLYARPGVLYWNAGIEAAIFVSGCLAVATVREARVRQAELLDRLRDAYRTIDLEMRGVGAIQRGMLPAMPPPISGHQIAVAYLTSTRAGGDYYDFVPLPDGCVGLFVADVSGHGAPAAVVMAMVRVLLHTAEPLPAEPAAVLARLDRQLRGNMPDGQFVTACYAVLDPRTHTLEYASAGHNPPFIARGVQRVETLSTHSGPPLGILAGATFSCERTTLAPGDTLLLYTDGLTEAMNATGAMFGEDGACATLMTHAMAPPEALRDRLVEAASAHAGAEFPTDDFTLIVVRAE